jgi:hypothetical protein
MTLGVLARRPRAATIIGPTRYSQESQMPRMLSRRSAILGLTLALTSIGVAQAATGRYLVHSFSEPASAGGAVTGPLGDDFVVVARARVVVSTGWQRLSAKPGRLRFLARRTASCGYTATFSVAKRLAAPADPAQVAAAALPAASSAYLLDSGVHGSRAFRVVRQRTTAGVRVDGLSTGIISRRSDLTSDGRVLWGDIHVVATSRPGDECHSGTYRQALGPQIGDVLATAKATFGFVRPAS